MRKPVQLELPRRGGARPGAGRPKGSRVSHHPRPQFGRVTPGLVTLKIRDGIPSLRSSRRFAAVRSAFAAARGLHGLRVVEFSVLGDHLHLIAEADDKRALSRGMQGLCIRIAKALNRVLGRTGGIFADHYHSRLLRSPSELCAALRYVLGNAEHHFGDRGADWFSSASTEGAAVRAEPRGWLLRIGWQRGAGPAEGRRRARVTGHAAQRRWRGIYRIDESLNAARSAHTEPDRRLGLLADRRAYTGPDRRVRLVPDRAARTLNPTAASGCCATAMRAH
jgi:REP element-mobilizing transposase RayT